MNSLSKICEAFEEIKHTSSRLKKDEILRKLIRKEKVKALLREMLVYAFHPYFNFWIREEKERGMHLQNGKDNWKPFKKALDKLREREVTGGAARGLIRRALDDIPVNESRWLIQILNRDLKIGMQLKSFEKHFPSLVPKFSPMLANSWDEKEIKEEVAIEPKLDGLRCLAIFPVKGEPTTVSRNGRPIYNTEKILAELSHIKGWVLDGEIIGSSWGEGVSFAHTKTKNKSSGKFIIFDAIRFEEWNGRKCRIRYSYRRKRMIELLGKIEGEYFRVIETKRGIFSSGEIKDRAERYIKDGREGVVIKRCQGKYDFKRSDNWLKYKYKTTDEFRVVDRVEGKGRNEGSLGALIVKGRVNGVKVKSEVGQGFTDADRKYFWRLDIDELKGLVIEVEHYGVTNELRMRASDKLPAIRNGVFLRIRKDKEER